MTQPAFAVLLSVLACAVLAAGPMAGAGGHALPAAPACSPDDPAPAHTINGLAFLAGAWSQERDGMYIEEIWSAPRGNNIIGSFRWLRPDGTPILFEILAITEEEGILRLRLRHYTAALVGKEPPDKPVTLHLSTLEPGRAVFDAERDAVDLARIEYHVEDDVLNITVTFTAEDRPPLVFRLKRDR